jgi:hypothetical protein
MRRYGLFSTGLVALLLAAAPSRADTPPSPLRLLPAESHFLVQIHNPRQFVERIYNLDAIEKFQNLAVIKEQLDATTPRRLRQLLAYFEKKLGAKYPELLDAIAGGGIAIAGTFGDKAPALMVVQGTDEKRVERFLAEAIEVLEGELKRQESKDRVVKSTYEGVAGYKVGDLFLARVGATLVAANHKDAMAKAIRLHTGKDKKSLLDHSSVIESKKLLPTSPLASVWIDMKPVHASPAGKELYASPRNNAQLTFLVGGYLDILGRSPFVCAALTLEKDDLTLSIRAPRGRDGSGPDRALHMGDGQVGSRPLLEPKGVLYSSSFHLDLGKLWTDRAKLFLKDQVKGFEDANKNSLLVFGGVRLEKVLEATAPYLRIVVVNAPKTPYGRQPTTYYPSFAFVPELKDPERFASAVGTALRFAALTQTGALGMKSVETKHAGHTIAGYRFDEKAEVKGDTDGVRFNFEPCFVRVGNQFVFCSRIDLCKELLDLLIAEQKSTNKGRPETVRDRLYASGVARYMADNADQLITQAILDQAASPAEAKKQIAQTIRFVESLGSFDLSTLYEANRFRYDIKLRLSKDTSEAQR